MKQEKPKKEKRKGISKKVRFEVFKRDRFTCQYCGRKAPDILLQLDHIEPVAKGGTDDIINLVTSCFDCNMGKRDKKLDDNSEIEKQRKQLELLEERREQIELMLEWRKSLSTLHDKTVDIVKEYAEKKICPFTINDNGKNKLVNLVRRFEVDEILGAIDISASTYLKCSDKTGELIQESVERFLDKLGGILFNRNLNPLQQKIAYIKNTAKRSCPYYFDSKRASILLNKYVYALRNSWNYDDDAIIHDLDTEVLSATIESRNWSDWQAKIQGWIDSIENPAK